MTKRERLTNMAILLKGFNDTTIAQVENLQGASLDHMVELYARMLGVLGSDDPIIARLIEAGTGAKRTERVKN